MYEQMAKVRDFHEKHGFAVAHSFSDDVKALADYDRGLLASMGEELGAAAQQLIKSALREGGERVMLVRMHLLVEELGEMLEAVSKGDEVKALDAITDLLYVLVGYAVSYDQPLAEAFDEVHASNMTKVSQVSDPHRARLRDKGPNFLPPDLRAVLTRWKKERAAVARLMAAHRAEDDIAEREARAALVHDIDAHRRGEQSDSLSVKLPAPDHDAHAEQLRLDNIERNG